jgi:CBS domain-containing protein
MQARDIMTTAVIAVTPDTSIRQVATVLRDNGISAVPVVDGSGALVGIVSEGDLIDRNDSERERRRDWWLEMLAEGTALSPAFLDFVRSTDRPVRQVMVAPVKTVSEDTPVEDIGELLQQERIKRVPVVREGRVVGIVSRADVLRALITRQSS